MESCPHWTSVHPPADGETESMKACPVSEPPFSASALGWQEAETTLPVGSGLGLFILHMSQLGKPTNSGFLGSPWPAGVCGLLEALTGPTTELFIGTTVLSSQRGEPSWTTDLNTAKSKETKAQSHCNTQQPSAQGVDHSQARVQLYSKEITHSRQTDKKLPDTTT